MGVTSRTRKCDSPAAQYGGNLCRMDGSKDTEMQTCYRAPCTSNNFSNFGTFRRLIEWFTHGMYFGLHNVCVPFTIGHYSIGIKGDKSCRTQHGQKITISIECRLACVALGMQIGQLKENQPCHTVDNATCTQLGSPESDSRMICKEKEGNVHKLRYSKIH